MSHAKKIWMCALSLLLTAEISAHAQSSDSSMLEHYAQLQAEQKKAEAIEEKARAQKEVVDMRRQDAERDVVTRKNKIENLKVQQEKSKNELDLLTHQLHKVNTDLESYKTEQKQLEESAAATLRYLESQRQELSSRKQELEAELRSIEGARKKAEHDVYLLAVDIEHFKADIAKSDTKVQQAQAKRAAVEADEAKLRSEWTEVKNQIVEHKKAQEAALAEIVDAKKQYDIAHKQLAEAKFELAKTEKARNDAVKRSQDEVGRFEREIAAANKARLVAEAEQIRMDTEVARVHQYSTRIKALRDHNLDMQAAAESMELKTNLAVEAARSAHSRAMEVSDQVIFKKEKETQKTRQMAAAVPAAPLEQAGRIWKTSADGCQAYKQADQKDKANFFGAEKKLLAREHGGEWIEIMNGSGASVFVPASCGSFQN